MEHSLAGTRLCAGWSWNFPCLLSRRHCLSMDSEKCTFEFKIFYNIVLVSADAGVGSRSLLQGIFPTQGLNRNLLHWRQILYQLIHQGSPKDNCFAILRWFLPYIDMNQSQAYIWPLPLAPPSHLPSHCTPLGCHRARV